MPDYRLIVLKFGGSILATEDRLDDVVHEIHRWRRDGWRVLAVVSALAGTTDRLVALAAAAADGAAVAERDPHAEAALLATGEQESAARLGLRLALAGIPARVLVPAAIGLRAHGPALDAELEHVDARTVHRSLDAAGVVIVPGFVAIDAAGRTVTLGRGGSDLSAVFLAHRLGAERCRLVKDVDGLYERDPATPRPASEPPPRRYATATWSAALLSDGSILQHKAVRVARDLGRPFEVAGLQAIETTLIGAAVTRFAGTASRGRPPVGVAILGGGTVGGSVLRLLARRPDRYTVIGVAVRDPARPRPWEDWPETVGLSRTSDAVALASDPRAAVVVEALGGARDARVAIARALTRGATVITANKAVLAAHGAELTAIAITSGGTLLASASVGGVMPVLEQLAAAGDRRVRALRGILNGTSNAVLEALAGGATPADAVTEARRRGLAESDASRDLDGRDAADKLRVIAGALGARDASAVSVDRDPWPPPGGVELATRQIATLGRTTAGEGGWRGSVRLIPLAADDPLAGVRGAGNRVVIEWEDGGTTVLEGAGAGGRPTAESIVGDLLAWRRGDAGPASRPGPRSALVAEAATR